MTSVGRVHLTIGSALDIFGGTGVRYEDAVAFNRRSASRQRPSQTAATEVDNSMLSRTSGPDTFRA